MQPRRRQVVVYLHTIQSPSSIHTHTLTRPLTTTANIHTFGRYILSSLLSSTHSYTPTLASHTVGSSSGVSSSSDEQQVLTGYLELLEKVIRIDPHVIPPYAFNGNLVKTFLNEFLFTMPTDDEQDKTPICDHVNTRHAAFGVISA